MAIGKYRERHYIGNHGPADAVRFPYEELRSHGFDDGDYMVRCRTCGSQFEGDKRAYTCRACAVIAIDRKTAQRKAEQADTFQSPPSGLGPTGDTGQHDFEDDGFLTANMAADHAEVEYRKAADKHMAGFTEIIPDEDSPILRLLAEGRIKQRLIADIYNEIRIGLDITDKNSRNRAYDVARKIVELMEDRDD